MWYSEGPGFQSLLLPRSRCMILMRNSALVQLHYPISKMAFFPHGVVRITKVNEQRIVFCESCCPLQRSETVVPVGSSAPVVQAPEGPLQTALSIPPSSGLGLARPTQSAVCFGSLHSVMARLPWEHLHAETVKGPESGLVPLPPEACCHPCPNL